MPGKCQFFADYKELEADLSDKCQRLVSEIQKVCERGNWK